MGCGCVPMQGFDMQALNFTSDVEFYAYVCGNMQKVLDSIDENNSSIEALTKIVNGLQDAIDRWVNGDIDGSLKDAISAWIGANLEYIFDKVVRQVFFGLTSDGYFCAYVPDSWSDIQFDTGMVYGAADYGHLILRYDVDGSGVIDNTGYVTEAIVNDLEWLMRAVGRNNTTLYTALEDAEVVKFAYTPLPEGFDPRK